MFLGLDCGTSRVKAVLVGADGRTLGTAAAPIGLQARPGGAVEQDLGEIWDAVVGTVRRLGEGRDLRGVAALGVASQGAALQIFDARGFPDGPVVSWLDGRGGPYDSALTAEYGRAWFADRLGHGSSGAALGQLERLKRERPELLRPPRGIGFVGDAVVGRLCGRRVHDASSLAIALLWDRRRNGPPPELLSRFGLTDDRLPVLSDPRRAAGALTPAAAAATGLPAGIPVSPAVHDQYAAALGAGAYERGSVMVGAGTAWVLLAAHDRWPAPADDRSFIAPHLLPGRFGEILSLVNGGSTLAWAMDLVGLDAVERQRLDEILDEAGRAGEAPLCLPLLAAVSPAGVSSAPVGSLAGLGFEHGRGHLLRAVLEGLCCELARHLRLLRAAGTPVERLSLCGSAAGLSRVTPQLLADITGLPVDSLGGAECGALGAAVLAAGLADASSDLAALAARMAPPRRRFEPGARAPACRRRLNAYCAAVQRPAPAETPAEAGDAPLCFVWRYRASDRAFWEEHLEPWIPQDLVDAHLHLGHPGVRVFPMTEARRRQHWVAELSAPLEAEEAVRCLATVFPRRRVRCVAMGSPDLDDDIESSNHYVVDACAGLGWHALILLRPQLSPERLDRELSLPGVIGVKPYYTLIGRDPATRDRYLEASLFDFLPHPLLEVLDRRRAWVTLHVPRKDRLPHPANVAEVRAIRERYPGVQLVIAHLGRCYLPEQATRALPLLADDPGLMWDLSAVMHPDVLRLALERLGPERLVYGTDNPVFFMRGRQQWAEGAYRMRTDYPFHFNREREAPEIEAGYTLMMYESLKALRAACERVGLGRPQVEAIFAGNARRLIDAAHGPGSS